MIVSASNSQVKNIIQLNQHAKARREQGLFAAEGIKMFLEAPAGWIKKVYLNENLNNPEVTERIQAEGIAAETAADSLFRKMCDTKTPQGVLTLLKAPAYSLEQLLEEENPLLIVLENLQDPGNAGTIFRTAEAAGAAGVILTRNSVDVLSPKVIRSTMGSIYRMPFAYVENVVSLREVFRHRQIRSCAAHLAGKKDYDQENYETGTAFLIGNEGNGLTEEAAAAADSLIRIPMKGKVESLNAAMAAGILLYEAAGQRRKGGGMK